MNLAAGGGMVRAMRMRMFIFVVLALAGCANSRTQRAPTVAAPPTQESAAQTPKRDFLQEAGDTTWRVVTAPARIITPPKKAEPQAPVTYEAPSVTFSRRSYVDEQAAPAPATQP